MPTYEYHCDSCDRNFDVVQSFHDDPLETCPTCGFPVRKVFGNVGIVFKGSGFYKTDSRAPAATKDGVGTSKDGKDAKEGAKAAGDGSPSDSGSGDGATPTTSPTKSEPASPASSAPAQGNGAPAKAKESTKT